MMLGNVGLVGRKRSGKDTAAQALVDELGFVVHSPADPLKDAALALDPIVHAYNERGCADWLHEERLTDVVGELGWEGAKDEYPEVRRLLQRLGDEAGRQIHGEDIWLRNLLRRVKHANDDGRPVAVPSVRYQNEVEHMRAEGFLVVRIDRPGVSVATPGEHASEQVEHLDVDAVIQNDGTVAELGRKIIDLVEKRARDDRGGADCE